MADLVFTTSAGARTWVAPGARQHASLGTQWWESVPVAPARNAPMTIVDAAGVTGVVAKLLGLRERPLAGYRVGYAAATEAAVRAAYKADHEAIVDQEISVSDPGDGNTYAGCRLIRSSVLFCHQTESGWLLLANFDLEQL